MYKKLKIYLDTSVPNFLFADDAPEKKEITIDLFDNFIYKHTYDTYISDVVLAEIEDTRDSDKRTKLLNTIKKYPIEIFRLTDEEETEIERMANKYIDTGVIPVNKKADALHVAVSLVKKINFLVSWNYKHLANVQREERIRVINLENNYNHDLRIITPLELIAYGN